jgi:hypothetical protein
MQPSQIFEVVECGHDSIWIAWYLSETPSHRNCHFLWLCVRCSVYSLQSSTSLAYSSNGWTAAQSTTSNVAAQQCISYFCCTPTDQLAEGRWLSDRPETRRRTASEQSRSRSWSWKSHNHSHAW